MEAGPEERRSECLGWNTKDVIEDYDDRNVSWILEDQIMGWVLTGWARPTSLVRWISITSGRSFLRPDDKVGAALMKSVLLCRSFARGWAERSSESRDISAAEPSSPELLLTMEARLRFFAFAAADGFAQSGTGCSRSN